MTRFSLRHLLCVALIAAAPFAAAAADRITVDDMLNAEDLDANWTGSAFSPDGKSLVYTVNAAAAKRPTWGYQIAGMLTMSRVFVMTNGGPAREIVGDADTFYSLVALDAWAPDSSGVLLLATHRDSYGFAKYDLASGKITPLPGRIWSCFIPTFAWTRDGRVLYHTIPDAMPQRYADAQMLRDIHTRWETTWNGKAPSTTIHSANPAFPQTEQKPGALMLADPKTGAAIKIADGDYASITVSPDGRHIAAVASREALNDAMHWTGRRGELQVFALNADGAKLVNRIADIDVAPIDGETAWSPSSKSLLVIGRKPGKKGESHLYAVDVASGKRRELSPQSLAFEKPAIEGGLYTTAWLGETAVASAAHAVSGSDIPTTGLGNSTTFEYGFDRNKRANVFLFNAAKPENLTAFAKASVKDFVVTQDKSVLVVADGALLKLTPGKGHTRLTPEGAPPILGFGTDLRNPPPAAQTAYYGGGDAERVSLLAIADGKPKRMLFDLKANALTPHELKGELVISAPDRKTVLTKIEDGWSMSFALDDGASHPLVTVNENLKAKAIAPVEKFTFKVGTRELNGYVLWPPNAKKGEKLPAVVTVYGGSVYGDQPPWGAKVDISTPIFSGQLLASEGYAVIYPSTPLGAGSDSDQPAQLAEAVVAAIDALAAGGRIDPKRIGVMGQSYGGFSTAALLSKRSDRLAAGVSTAGLYNFFHGYGARALPMVFSDEPLSTIWAKFIEEGQGNLGKPFWQAPDAYIRNSPIFHVDTLDSPLLMIHGDLDLGATDLAGAERMYVAMLRAGKKPTLVHYWGEGHVAASAVVLRDQWQRITAWFDYHLRKKPGS